MKIRNSFGVLTVAALAVGTGLMSAEAVPGKKARFGGSIGADVAVCDLPAMTRWGSRDGITAYSLGTTSVNLGDVDLLWIAGTNEHPRIPQNAFRFAEGRLVRSDSRGARTALRAGRISAVRAIRPDRMPRAPRARCSDPYSSVNGSQSGLARGRNATPRPAVPVPPAEPAERSLVTDRRLQIRILDLNDNVWPDAKFYADAFYLIQQDFDAATASTTVPTANSRWAVSTAPATD